jgi:CxxC motif-containing protein (DUF1111 family)
MGPVVRRVISLLGALTGLAMAAIALGPAHLPAADEPPTEAPAGFTGLTNGFTDQAAFDANRTEFEEEARIVSDGDEEGGLGPTFNARSCVACHDNPIAGGSSQVAELRVGKLIDGVFVEPPGGTLVRQRAIDPTAQQRVPEEFTVRTRRMSTSVLGLGFVEFVKDADILAVQASQPVEMRGTAVLVPVTVGVNPDGTLAKADRLGRFGWKCQHGSLLDFSADANRNEKGVTSPIQPTEAPAIDGRDLSQFDRAEDPEDPPTPDFPFGKNVTAYTRFMRATRVPPRDHSLQGSDDVRAGERLFATVGCAVCHVPSWTTPPAGTVIRGSQPVPAPLGNKVFHPYSDLMLHNIGTGDGIVQGGPPETKDMVRTALLWGLRTRPELLHDGSALTVEDAIQRHGGQAAGVRLRYRNLTPGEQRQLKLFLLSL